MAATNMPQQPGYYWAKWQIAADGTVEGDELTPAANWEIVQVNSNISDWDDYTDEQEPERLSVSVPGVQMTQWRDCFLWGEFVAPLERAARPTPAETESFQQEVDRWLIACFGEKIARDKTERNHRFLEEALELVQSGGCTASEAHQLVDYVYNRPIGEMHQEVGGVMNTLAALCLAYGLDMVECGNVEIARCWTKVEKIRAKQAAKPKHSPLPEHVPTPEQAQAVKLIYTNWRGETAERLIIPLRVWYGSTEWHPEPQWLLRAIDTDKKAERDFALKDFGAARPTPPSEDRP